ncbi:hypothetical protein Q8F55_002837 [Vanrija albida]|uniref:HIT-type domain-containing protein n=1 Tax=Vanrija albida TaxID=181172 RepID=A0ABR3QBG5_9TREE
MVNLAPVRPGQPLTDFQARRIQRRLEDLERTNPTDIPPSSFKPPDPAPNTPAAAALAAAKKKQTPNVRRALYGKKSLRDWLEELPATPTPPYVTAAAPEPATPPRRLCASCGYIGAVRCFRCGEWSCGKTCAEVHERDGGCGVGA